MILEDKQTHIYADFMNGLQDHFLWVLLLDLTEGADVVEIILPTISWKQM